MKKKNIIRIILLGLFSLVLLAVLGLFAWSGLATYPAGPVAQAALQSDDDVSVTQGKHIVFTPVQKTHTGLIFYPGGLVEPAAYAPVLHQIAQEGVLVIVAPMPFNLAIFNPGAAKAAIDAYPNIERWFLAGHSLGGASAAIFAYNNPEKLAGLAFWDSYPPDFADLSESTLPVLSIFGTTANLPNTEDFDLKRPLLPGNAQFVSIEGANHSQFGDYGPQKGDVSASISQSEQHQRVAGIMLDFIFPAE